MQYLTLLKDIIPRLWEKWPRTTAIICALLAVLYFVDIGNVQKYIPIIAPDIHMQAELNEWNKKFLEEEGLRLMRMKVCDEYETIRYLNFASKFGPYLKEDFATSKELFIYNGLQGRCYKVVNNYIGVNE